MKRTFNQSGICHVDEVEYEGYGYDNDDDDDDVQNWSANLTEVLGSPVGSRPGSGSGSGSGFGFGLGIRSTVPMVPGEEEDDQSPVASGGSGSGSGSDVDVDVDGGHCHRRRHLHAHAKMSGRMRSCSTEGDIGTDTDTDRDDDDLASWDSPMWLGMMTQSKENLEEQRLRDVANLAADVPTAVLTGLKHRLACGTGTGTGTGSSSGLGGEGDEDDDGLITMLLDMARFGNTTLVREVVYSVALVTGRTPAQVAAVVAPQTLAHITKDLASPSSDGWVAGAGAGGGAHGSVAFLVDPSSCVSGVSDLLELSPSDQWWCGVDLPPLLSPEQAAALDAQLDAVGVMAA